MCSHNRLFVTGEEAFGPISSESHFRSVMSQLWCVLGYPMILGRFGRISGLAPFSLLVGEDLLSGWFQFFPPCRALPSPEHLAFKSPEFTHGASALPTGLFSTL